MSDYEWDIRCADLELSRIQDGFTTLDHLGFARVLFAGYARVQADIHVESGRLKSSAHASVDRATSQHWEGEISVGGGGIKYAGSEFFGYADKHGGYPSHQYFKSVGWLPQPRFGDDGEGGVPRAVLPIRDTGGGRGVAIQDDMMEPAEQFFARGHRTPHPEALS